MAKKNKTNPNKSGISLVKAKESLADLFATSVTDDVLNEHSIGEITHTIMEMAKAETEIANREQVFQHLIQQFLKEDSVWYVHNNVTNYPMSFVPVTVNKEHYSIRPGDIWFATKEYRDKVALEIASNPDFALKEIKKNQLKDFLMDMFYTNGYGGIRFNYIQFSIARENILRKPEPTLLMDAKDLIKNPIVVNRLISANQYLYTSQPLSEIEELTKKICIQAFIDECLNANFLLAVRPADERIFQFNNSVSKKDTKLLFETVHNPNTGREMVALFTDWNKTKDIPHCEGTIPRMMKIKDVINQFDVGINLFKDKAHCGVITKEIWDKAIKNNKK